MKNIFKFIVLIIITISCNAHAQLDTLNYVKQFEANKSQYINQPFSKLLNEMTQLQPKSHWADTPFNNKNVVHATQFLFCNMDYIGNRVVILRIIWQDYIPYSEIKYLQNKNGFYFTDEEKTFYGNKIVKDIMVYK